jgi:hypothetical protein
MEPENGSDRPLAEAQDLPDWDAYFHLLLSGQLERYRGKFVVVLNGAIVAEGDDPEQLRRRNAQDLQVPAERLVIAFVEQSESVVAD